MALVASIHVDAGWLIPDMKLRDVDGQEVELRDERGERGLLVAFTCNHCPYALAIWPRLIRHAVAFRQKGVGTVAINPNIRPDYPEDSVVAMKEKIVAWGIDFSYLADEMQQVARAFDAQCTPDLYLFDAGGKLHYHGRMDDYWKDEIKVTQEELVLAVDAMLAGQPAPQPQHPSIGCSIKWRNAREAARVGDWP